MYGLNIDPMNPQGNPQAAELRDLGVQMVRYTFKDQTAGSQPDPERVRFYTAKLQEYSSSGISSLIILSYETYPNKPTFTAPDAEWDAYINLYIQRIRQLAQVLAPWRPAFQIWNEPDLPPNPGYEPSLREAVYGRLLRRAYEASKAVDPTVTVVGAGLASGDPNWWTRVVQSQGGNLQVDANAIHPYGQRPEPAWPHAGWGFGYVGDLINRYRAAWNGPLWITESGASTNNEEQAEYLRRFYRTITSQFSATVKWVHWFCYSDGMVFPYGLISGSGQRKPAYTAYREITPDTPPPPPRPAYAVEYLGHNTPATGIMGQTNAVTLRIRNTSYRTWPAGGLQPVRLGYHWYTLAGEVVPQVLWDDNRTGLPFDVRPDQEVTLTANLSIPRALGEFEVRWDMVEEMVTWFAWQNVPTLNVRVRVQAAPPPPPTGTLHLSASHNNVTSGTDNLLLAIDNNPYTRWSTQTPQRPGMWFQVDLGEARPTSYVRLDNAVSPQDYPRGYILKVSTDGQNWTTVAQNANNTRPVEVIFSSRPVRFIRIEQTGSDPIYWWAIHGLEIANEVKMSASASHNSVLVGADNLNQALDGQTATRWSSRALQQPGMWFELDLKEPSLVQGLRLELGSSTSDYPRGYVVRVSNDRLQWQEVARRDQNTAALDVNFTPRSVRYLRIEQTGQSSSSWWSIHEVTLRTAMPDTNLRLSASHNNVTTGTENLLQALDGNPATRWSTRTVQRPGMWLEIDLNTIRMVNSLALNTEGSPNDYPRGYVVRFSPDRTNWLEVARNNQNNGPLALTFTGRCARYIRIEQTGQSDLYWWSVHELIVISEPAPQGGSGQVSATASHNNVTSGADNILMALNASATDRWSSRALQQPGMWFEIDLNSIRLVNGLTLDNAASPSDYPRGYIVRVSTDRQLWDEVARNPNNTQALNLNFSPRCARYIRIEQSGRADQFWWSIHRVGIRYASG